MNRNRLANRTMMKTPGFEEDISVGTLYTYYSKNKSVLNLILKM